MTIIEDYQVKGKLAVVTGASRGLGQAMAEGLAEAGADIIGISTNADNLKETGALVEKLGRKFHALSCDVSDYEDIERAVAECKKIGGVDILVNNAGIIRRSPAVEYSNKDWLDVVETNLNGLFYLCRSFGGEMVKRKSGKIINIASLLSFSGGITVPAYAASKGAVMQLTKALANEWAAHNVQVNAIAPGYFETDNTAALRADEGRYSEILKRIPADRWGQPHELKGACVFLASKASNYVNGHVLAVDGGFLAR